jgi:hypothetical protein
MRTLHVVWLDLQFADMKGSWEAAKEARAKPASPETVRTMAHHRDRVALAIRHRDEYG